MFMLIHKMLASEVGLATLNQFSRGLEPLPEGVQRVADNVWLIETEVAADFLLKAGGISGRGNPNVRAYSTVPKLPVAL